MRLCHQLKQFFKAFPEPGSWAYNLNTFAYDLKHGVVVQDINIDPMEGEPNDSIEINNLDSPAYLRRGIVLRADSDELSAENCEDKCYGSGNGGYSGPPADI